MPYGTYLYTVTALIVVAELIAGRYRGFFTGANAKVMLGCTIASAIGRPLSALFIAVVVACLLPQYRGVLAGTPPVLAYLAVLSVSEFCFYWAHRWSHEMRNKPNDWLWKLHRTHHAGKYMNVAVTLRLNVFWSFVVPTSWVIGLATYLGLEQAAGLTVVTIYGWNLITHAHFRWDDPIRRAPVIGPAFRALEHVLVSPGIHHSHHGYGKDGRSYGNYALTFSWLDWIFGTLHIPEGRPWRYGLPGPMPHWAEEIAWPLVRIKQPTPSVVAESAVAQAADGYPS